MAKPSERAVPAIMLLAALLAGCTPPLFDPARASGPYPEALHRPESIDVQVFRDGEYLEIVNSSPRTYHDVTVWVNQRYARHVEDIPAGETVRLRLWDFYDQRGEVLIAGGFFATQKPTPVRLVELAYADETGADRLLGLVTIRAEDLGE